MLFKKFFSLAALAVCASAESIVELLQSQPDLSTLLSLVSTYPDLVQTLTTTQGITVFAPTNEAFNTLLTAMPDLKNQPDVIKAVLTYHVSPKEIPAKSIPLKGVFAPTLLTNETYSLVTGGQVVKANRLGKKVILTSGGGAKSKVVTADVKFDNGIAHVIDKVLTIPPSVADVATAANLTTLATALTETNLLDTVNTLPDSTVFAPTNEAFAKLPSLPTGDALASVLTYHVVNGTVAYSVTLKEGEEVATVNGAKVKIGIFGPFIFINKARVIKKDVLTKTGVVHVINQVLNVADAPKH